MSCSRTSSLVSVPLQPFRPDHTGGSPDENENIVQPSPDKGGLGTYAEEAGKVRKMSVGIETTKVRKWQIMVEYRGWGGDMRNVGLEYFFYESIRQVDI